MDPQQLTLRFRLGRIPVTVEPMFWLAMLMFGSNQRGPALVLWMLIAPLSILVHELGHALTAMAFGARVSVRLHTMGGHTHFDRPLSRAKDVAVTLAGPFAGFAMAGLVWLALWEFPTLALSPNLRTAMGMALSVNLWWGLINLLPVPPLDGGQIALAVAGPRHQRVARILAVVVAGAVVVWSLSEASLYRALLFGMLGYQNLQMLSRRTAY